MSNAEIAERLEEIGRELDEHPERWTQGELAKNAQGYRIPCQWESATSWCAEGFIGREFTQAIHENSALGTLRRVIGQCLIHDWNDAPGRTAAEVAAAFHEAARLARQAEGG